MAVTDAQYLDFLRGQNETRLTLLAEIQFAYESGGSLATGTIYLSDAPYRTKPTDSPANIAYRAIINSAPDFERGIDVRELGGRASMNVGSLVLNNADGSAEFLAEAIIDGREIKFYVGDFSWARSDFRLVNVAVVAGVRWTDTEFTIELLSKNYLLDDTIVGDTITTGPNAGKVKPVLIGTVKNVDATPYLFDTANLKYYINNAALYLGAFKQENSAVRDAGLSLDSGAVTAMGPGTPVNTGTDTITIVGHTLAVNDVIYFSTILAGSIFAGLTANSVQYWVISAGLTADDFRVSLTKGGAAVDITGAAQTGTFEVIRRRYHIDHTTSVLELSATPAGRVTYDITATPGTSVASDNPHEWFKYILDTYTQISASEYDAAAIETLRVAEVSNNRMGMAILDRMNVLDVLDAIALATYSWYGWTSAGVLTVGRLALGDLDSATSIDSISDDDVLGDVRCENLPLPFGRLFVNGQANAAVQTDGLAAAVSAADKSKYGQPFQYRVGSVDPATSSYLANWWDYHKSAIDSKPLDTVASGGLAGTDDSTELTCAEIHENNKPWTRVYRATVGIDKYALNPGDCITATYPRHGLSAGKKVRVMSVKPKFSERQCDLVMVRQVTPDYTTASYP